MLEKAPACKGKISVGLKGEVVLPDPQANLCEQEGRGKRK
jgi:hypothetical protein